MRAKWQAVHRNYCSLCESLTDKPCLVSCLLLLQNLLAGEVAGPAPVSTEADVQVNISHAYILNIYTQNNEAQGTRLALN